MYVYNFQNKNRAMAGMTHDNCSENSHMVVLSIPSRKTEFLLQKAWAFIVELGSLPSTEWLAQITKPPGKKIFASCAGQGVPNTHRIAMMNETGLLWLSDRFCAFLLLHLRLEIEFGPWNTVHCRPNVNWTELGRRGAKNSSQCIEGYSNLRSNQPGQCFTELSARRSRNSVLPALSTELFILFPCRDFNSTIYDGICKFSSPSLQTWTLPISWQCDADLHIRSPSLFPPPEYILFRKSFLLVRTRIVVSDQQTTTVRFFLLFDLKKLFRTNTLLFA